MKRLILIAAAAGLLAAPVLAQTSQQKPTAERVKAAEKAQKTGTKNDVYCGGKYVGSDPDAAVREQIKRDFGHCD
jgi:opacity protein-like surface antigen